MDTSTASVEVVEPKADQAARVLIPQKHGGALMPGRGKPGGLPAWKPGESGNPRGRPSMGAAFAEWVNQLNNLSMRELQDVADDEGEGVNKRAAARYLIEHFASKLDVTKELCDRTEGKALQRQQIETTSTHLDVAQVLAEARALVGMVEGAPLDTLTGVVVPNVRSGNMQPLDVVEVARLGVVDAGVGGEGEGGAAVDAPLRRSPVASATIEVHPLPAAPTPTPPLFVAVSPVVASQPATASGTPTPPSPVSPPAILPSDSDVKKRARWERARAKAKEKRAQARAKKSSGSPPTGII